jgi:hypothetical protein
LLEINDAKDDCGQGRKGQDGSSQPDSQAVVDCDAHLSPRRRLVNIYNNIDDNINLISVRKLRFQII